MSVQLYIIDGKEESSSHYHTPEETFKAQPIAGGLYLGRQVDHYNDGQLRQWVYSMEIPFGGGDKELTVVGILNATNHMYSHTHGYYPNHKTGIKLQKWATSNGYEKL